MSQTDISVNQQIKKIIQNLDLDLNSELDRYEQSLVQNAVLVSSSTNNSNDRSSPNLVYQSSLVEPELGQDTIAVSSHLIEERTPVLNRILTPWGIFGIIIFFGTNLFILFNLDFLTAKVNQPVNNINEQQRSLPENTQKENSLASNPNSSSPYPDLTTALLTEVEKQQSPPPQTSAPAKQNENVAVKQNLSQPSKQTNKYYLMKNYQNMNDFTQTKKVVPSASLININQEMKIQLTVFDNADEAQKRSQQLKDKGIDNYVYNPAK